MESYAIMIQVTAFQFKGSVAYAWYTYQGEEATTRIDAEAFHSWLLSNGHIPAGTPLIEYIDRAPSKELVFDHLAKFMAWRVEERELACIAREQHIARQYFEHQGDGQIEYMRNYAF